MCSYSDNSRSLPGAPSFNPSRLHRKNVQERLRFFIIIIMQGSGLSFIYFFLYVRSFRRLVVPPGTRRTAFYITGKRKRGTGVFVEGRENERKEKKRTSAREKRKRTTLNLERWVKVDVCGLPSSLSSPRSLFYDSKLESIPFLGVESFVELKNVLFRLQSSHCTIKTVRL